LGESLVCLALSFGASACGGSQPPPSSTPEASPSAPSGDTSTSPVDATSAHGASIFVVHLISDFATFKKYFDDGAAERAKIGVKGHLLTRLDGDRVVIHFVADNVGQAEDALRSPSIQKFFERAGAPDSSLIWVTKNIVLDMPKTPPSGETFSLFLRVKVADFAALKSDFEQRRSVFAEQGVIGEGLHQSTAQDNVAILHFVGTAKDKLEALPKRAEFIELLKHAGVKDEVKPLVGVDVERSRQN
jgi:hypothetical protein